MKNYFKTNISNVNRNLVVNILTKVIVSLFSFAVIPQFLSKLTAESYGLIAFFTLFTNLLSIFDFGLVGALQRELAVAKPVISIHNLVRSIEIIFWGIGLAVSVLIFFATPLVARYWIKAVTLSHGEICGYLHLLSLSLIFVFPASVYINGLLGLQRQITANVISICFSFFRTFGVLFVWFIFPCSLSSFFYTQIAIGVIQTAVSGYILWQNLPPTNIRSRFDTQALKQVYKFAFGIFSLSVLSIILINMDKIVVSKLLTIDNYAYYSLASSAAAGLYFIITPIFTAYYPKFIELFSKNENIELAEVYHHGCYIMTLILLPLTFFLFFFANEALAFWIRNPQIIPNVVFSFRILILGTAANGLMNLPFAMQLAKGSARLSIWQNIISVLVFIPFTAWAVSIFGPKGAALSWLVHNLLCVLIMLPLIHHFFFKNQTKKWYIRDVGIPGIIAFLSALFFYKTAKYFNINSGNVFVLFFSLLACYSTTFLLTKLLNREGFLFPVLRK